VNTSSTVVRTVLGDVPSADLGFTYAHEHLALDNALIAAGFPNILLDDTEVAVREVTECKAAGVRAMVDAMPCAAGRDVVRLAEISHGTGVHILAVTGLLLERYYGLRHWTSQVTADELGDLFTDDVLLGVDAFDYSGPMVRRTKHRAGLVKIATAGEALGRRDVLLIEAAAIAHSRSGAPIVTHCEHGLGALEQVEALTRHGVPAGAILLSHIDKVTDIGYHHAIAQSGAWLLYDQSIRDHDAPTVPTAEADCPDVRRWLFGPDPPRHRRRAQESMACLRWHAGSRLAGDDDARATSRCGAYRGSGGRHLHDDAADALALRDVARTD
jgi:predicted metal-dependent phosphotriesterase family hydrolase